MPEDKYAITQEELDALAELASNTVVEDEAADVQFDFEDGPDKTATDFDFDFEDVDAADFEYSDEDIDEALLEENIEEIDIDKLINGI